MVAPPNIRVYFGIVTAESAEDGDCNTLTFGFQGEAAWNPAESVNLSGLKCNNSPSCDVKVTAPGTRTPAGRTCPLNQAVGLNP